MSREVVIVDYDCLTSAGADVAATWENLAANRSGIEAIRRYDPEREPLHGVAAISYGGEIPLSYAELAGSADRYAKWPEPAFHAVKVVAGRILGRLGFDASGHDPQRIAMLGGSALTAQISQDIVTRTGAIDTKFILHQCHNVPLAATAAEFGIQGPSFSIGSACASSGHAVFLARQFIQTGMVDCALVFGYEFPILPVSVAGFEWLKAVYRRDDPGDRAYDDAAAASRPFSRDRRGLLLAEGTGGVFLSAAAYARKMGWPARGAIRGGYVNSDAGHFTRISPDNIAVCMRAALADARANGEDVDCVNAHATSTSLGDATELAALHAVFGERLARIPVVANKSQIGHTLGASSVLALVLTLEAMRHGVVPPTLNHLPDERLPPAWVPARAVEHEHEVTLLNSFGFGGTNVSLVVERRAE
jgi:3-oxoacyl-[acyl-carrier-protein] synthase II